MKHLVLSLLITCPLMVNAADQIITCDPPQGTRIDFFSYNKINLQNNTFLMGRDQVQGMKPKLILHDDKTISLVIGDATQTTANTKQGSMKILVENNDQVSFVGMINDAPVLGTYYPKNAILIYSQQSIWPGPDYQGARAVIFYSKCGNHANNSVSDMPSMGTVPTGPTDNTTMPQTAPTGAPMGGTTPTTATPMQQSTPAAPAMAPATPTPMPAPSAATPQQAMPATSSGY